MARQRPARQSSLPPIQTPPTRIARILDRVRELDRVFFAEHPGILSRCRPFVPGESYPYRLRDCDEVIVKRIKPGVRLVVPLVPGGTALVWSQMDLPPQGGQK